MKYINTYHSSNQYICQQHTLTDYKIYVPINDVDNFKKNIEPNFKLVFSKLNTSVVNSFLLEMYLNTLKNYSPEFIKKITTQLKTLNTNQIELFLELIRFNFNQSKKYNPLFDILRIKNGILTKKIFTKKVDSSHIANSCAETYKGFLRAFKSKTLKLIEATINGKKTKLLVKTSAGQTAKSNKVGTSKLALDPITFDVYDFLMSGKGTNLKPINLKIQNNRKNVYVDEFINYRLAKSLLKDPLTTTNDIKFLKEIISQIDQIKKHLKEYTLEKTTKRNESFKKASKRMLSDKKTRDVIKKRFRK